MKRWFSGKFAGHYRGTLQPASGLSPLPQGEHFRVEIYEAIVSEIELGPLEESTVSSARALNSELLDRGTEVGLLDEAAEEAGVSSTVVERKKPAVEAKYHHVPKGPSLHQSHIGQVHFMDAVRPGQTIRGTAHDVLLSTLHFTHPARHGELSFGRVEGIISGWFRPPPEPEPVREVEPPPAIAPVGWSSDVVRSPGTDRAHALGRSGAPQTPPAAAQEPFAAPQTPPAAPQEPFAAPQAPPAAPQKPSVGPQVPSSQVADSAAEREVHTRSQSGRAFAREPEKVRLLRDTDERLMPVFRLESLQGGVDPTEEDAFPSEDEAEDDLGPDFEPSVEVAPPRQYPFFTLGACATVLLAFLATPFAAALFAVPFLASYVLRRWLVTIVPDGSFTRFLSLCIGTGQVLLGALTIAHWATLGCVALSPFSLLLLISGQFTSALLPRPLTYAITSGMLAIVLLQAYASWALGPCA